MKPEVRASLTALAIGLVALLAGLIGILLLRSVLSSSITETEVFRVVSGNLIQVGFAGFGLAYLGLQSDVNRFLLVRRPTLADAAWAIGITLAIVLLGAVVAPGLSMLGLPEPNPSGDGTVSVGTDPVLWLTAFIGLYLFAAPAEELIFRGLVQGHLRSAFEEVEVVAGGAIIFGLFHFVVGLLTSGVSFGGSLHWGLSALVPGVIWGYAYERTENLIVTSTSHALTWTVPFHVVLPFL